MSKPPPTDELQSANKTGFYMIDHIRTERIPDHVFGVRHRLWMIMLQGTDDRGYIGHTQRSLSIQLGVSECQIQRHYSIFKRAGMIKKGYDSEGRSRFRVMPEYYFNFNRQARNAEVDKRLLDKQPRKDH